MANALFKGDLAEVSFGKETGLHGQGDAGTTGFVTTVSGNTSTIVIGTNAANYWRLKLPDNVLVGCVLRINAASGNMLADDYASTRRTFYITAWDTTAHKLTIQPNLASGAVNADADASFTIDSFRSPTFETGMTDNSDEALNKNHKVKTDQFIGLLNELGLPEPEIDVRKQHVVGMGRDVNVITSGRETLSGGSLEINAHSLRWLKYALGGHTAKSNGSCSTTAAGNHTVTTALFNVGTNATIAGRAELQSDSTEVADLTTIASGGTVFAGLDTLTTTTGTNVIIGAKVASVSSTTATLSAIGVFSTNGGANGGIIKVNNSGTTSYASYTSVSSNDLVGVADIDSGAATLVLAANKCVVVLAPIAAAITEGDTRVDVGATVRAMYAAGDYLQIIDKDTHQIPGQDATPPTIFKHEIRRVIAVEGDYVHVEEPFTFSHTVGSCGLDRLRYNGAAEEGSPNIASSTKELQNGVNHTIFGHTTLPSFTIEQSFRNSDATPGGEQLLRLYSGCKANGASLTADTEGELKLSLEYEASRSYTDTGGRFTPHRMFDNTANTSANRKVSGIAVDGEKPYLFQDISIEIFGRPVLRATEFNISVTNSNTSRWYIRGYEGTTSDTDQVQHGATQTSMDITEGQREYTFSFKALVEDDRMWEELRTRRHHQNTNDITFTMNKVGSATTRQSATITIEDYTIMKADHQIPSDKGPITADVELVVRHMKLTESNPYYIL
jgi:hypothetical protein